MPNEAVAAILQTFGGVGAIALVLGLALRTLHRQLLESNERRIMDAQASTSKLLELVGSQHEAGGQMRAAIDANADAIGELRGVLEQLLAERGSRLPADLLERLEALLTERGPGGRLPPALRR